LRGQLRIEAEEVLFQKHARGPWAAAAIVAAALVGAAAPVVADEAGPVNPYSGNAEIAKEGGSLFNQYCSHCHGPWADQAERPRDLRRLRIRYGDDAIKMFYTTVNNGRMEMGMPVWKGVLSEDVLWKIYTYLETRQVEE
jgi:mono/diheme cytochrome c family protein